MQSCANCKKHPPFHTSTQFVRSYGRELGVVMVPGLAGGGGGGWVGVSVAFRDVVMFLLERIE